MKSEPMRPSVSGEQEQVASITRQRFDEVYGEFIERSGFVEIDNYYEQDKDRYWRTLEMYQSLSLPHPSRVLEIGGGQLAILLKKLCDDVCAVGDISSKYRTPIDNAGVQFFECDLLTNTQPEFEKLFDTIILLEVIEHIPYPAHVIFSNLKKLLRPGGVLFITTPNLYRLRNLVRMFLGREFFGPFTLPELGISLGHQLEYSAEHISWQFKRAGYEIVFLEHDQLGVQGHSAKARLGRKILAPLQIRPKWRENLVVAARKPEE